MKQLAKMKKRLIIIYNEGTIGKNYLKGVLKDVENYQEFFTSLEGGAWLSEEIKIFHKPNISQLFDHINKNVDSEYFMIVFCGHGGSLDEDTILELNNKDDLPLSKLYSWVSHTRNLIICDCCRVAPTIEPITESHIIKTKMFSKDISRTNIIKARMAYHKAIRLTDYTISTIGFAASLGEKAGESVKGGYYSYSLLKAAAAAVRNPNFVEDTITFLDCHYMAESAVEHLSRGRQHPDYYTTRDKNQLPFVVKVKNIVF